MRPAPLLHISPCLPSSVICVPHLHWRGIVKLAPTLRPTDILTSSLLSLRPMLEIGMASSQTADLSDMAASRRAFVTSSPSPTPSRIVMYAALQTLSSHACCLLQLCGGGRGTSGCLVCHLSTAAEIYGFSLLA